MKRIYKALLRLYPADYRELFADRIPAKNVWSARTCVGCSKGISCNRRVRESILLRVLQGAADANIGFGDLRGLLLALGFSERVKGSHHIFTRSGVAEILNLQPLGSLAKPYQVKQVRKVILRYKLAERAE